MIRLFFYIISRFNMIFCAVFKNDKRIIIYNIIYTGILKAIRSIFSIFRKNKKYESIYTADAS
jgi:hypothetical protein